MFKLLICFIFSVKVFAALPLWKTPSPLPLIFSVEPTPFYLNSQLYLNPAPQGVGAREAWMKPGGQGENVRVIDIEVGFNSHHEDLGEVLFNPSTVMNEHGTAVLGVIRGALNSFGVTGLASQAKLGFYGFPEGEQDVVDEKYIQAITKGIRLSLDQLQAGDVLVIEQHMNGPDQGRYTAVEYWPQIFDELKKVTEKGVHCVEAAGNGNSNFDSAVYKNAFDLKVRDSGCILVGAGSSNSHERMGFSNYGQRVDVQGYGENVTTTGYGDLFNAGVNREYTQSFNGTSSATPIIAGVVALVSSIAQERKVMITPSQMRAALRNTGTPQGGIKIDKKIGNFPNLPELFKALSL